MPRKPRKLEAETVYHVFNRRTDCQPLFTSDGAFDDFLDLMARGRDRYNVRICTYCLMETHWHQGIWIRTPEEATAVATYLRWLSACHAMRFRRSTSTVGHGHVYQDRYKSKRVLSEVHYLTLVRYIEANPLSAQLVERAEDWQWSSLAERLRGGRRIIQSGPVALPSDWVEVVNGGELFGEPSLE